MVLGNGMCQSSNVEEFIPKLDNGQAWIIPFDAIAKVRKGLKGMQWNDAPIGTTILGMLLVVVFATVGALTVSPLSTTIVFVIIIARDVESTIRSAVETAVVIVTVTAVTPQIILEERCEKVKHGRDSC